MLHLEIVTPEKKIFSDTVEDVYLPGEDGEMGVLSLHAALVTVLKPGELRYQKDGETIELAIGAGFAEVAQDKLIILTDMALDDEQIDIEKAEEAIKRAEEALKLHEGDDPQHTAQLELTIAKNIFAIEFKRKRRKSI
ncbi:ATP synthase F1 subunit epsilon [Persicirhabdus sediminis]|uniref:ATP synthase epsilon chain n=1 Tax=Persicirhabdus sediminis TaxID=454144 RepID=A0A8J7SKP8_9BACT|nr:ATP synthase F1 subunit epsilon [Persicirhabdus sediminis]MBK1792239.1 ATP synthase F1 subunit epsilon [Persicirhabdus sediminis]